MSGRVLLDTNVIIDLFANAPDIKENLTQASEVFVPIIAIGELYYGALKSGRVKENLAQIEKFAANNVVLACDSTTACRDGEIKNTLRKKGRPIPENDIWIAAIGLQYDLSLITQDTHFDYIESLKASMW